MIAALILAMPMTNAAVGDAAPPTASPAKSVVHKATNSHLHRPAVQRKETVGVHRSHWWHRWNAWAWFATHRGTGVIQGIVRNAAGVPEPGVSVRLRDAHGHPIRHKHITSTGTGGTFVMTHVRTRRYRVVATRGSASGYTLIVMHAGQSVMVSVKL